MNVEIINKILAKAGTKYQIDGDQLVFDGPELIPSPEVPKSLLDEAKRKIDESLKEAEKLFREGRYRPAVRDFMVIRNYCDSV